MIRGRLEFLFFGWTASSANQILDTGTSPVFIANYIHITLLGPIYILFVYK